jgi:rhomboid protease GluP
MPFFIYGFDIKSGEPITRFIANAQTETYARRKAEQQGLRVTAVVRSLSTRGLPEDERSRAEAASKEQAEALASKNAAHMSEYHQHLITITPHAYVAYALIAVNLLLFVLMMLDDGGRLEPSMAGLMRWGANYAPQTLHGDWWRLFSAMFVHNGIRHLLFNTLALAYVGPAVERRIGNFGFLALYLFSGVAGNLWSIFWSPMTVGAGASGAIFGIVAALFPFVHREYRAFSDPWAAGMRRTLLLFTGLNFFLSLFPGISLAAHVGGFMAGGVGSLVLASTLQGQSPARRLRRSAALTICGVILVVGGISAAHVRYPNLERLARLLRDSNTLMLEFKAAERRVAQDEFSDSNLAELVEKRLLPKWRATRESLSALVPVPTMLEAEIHALVNYMGLRQEAWEAYVEVARVKAAQVKGKPGESIEYLLVRGDTSEHFDQRMEWRGEIFDAYLKNRSDLIVLLTLFLRMDELCARWENAVSLHGPFRIVAKIEKDFLPKWRSVRGELTELNPVPAGLDGQVSSILNFMRVRQEYWESRVDFMHFSLREKDARAKRNLATDAAISISDKYGAHLLPVL